VKTIHSLVSLLSLKSSWCKQEY